MAPADPATEQERRLQWLLVWRLIVGGLLLGGTLWLNLGAGLAADGFTPVMLSVLIVGTFTSSVLALAGRLAGWPLTPRALIPLLADLVLATGLVYLSGGAASAFSILYGAAVLSAAVTLGGRAATFTTAASIVLYVLVGLALSAEWVPPPPDQNPQAYRVDIQALGYSLLSNLVGLVVVGGLSVALAARLQKERGVARAAEQERARLSQLNDDIVRSLSSGLVTLSDDERITSINPAGLEMLGLAEHRVLGEPVGELLGFTPAMDRRAEQHATLPDGRVLVLGYSRTPLVDSSGRSLLLFQDLTEIQDLRTAAKRAEQLAVLGHLAAGLAHEIRNPLGAIRGSVQLVRDASELNEEDATLLDLVQGEVLRLNELVTTMLAVGRPVAPTPTDIDLADVAQGVSQLVSGDQELLGSKTIQVEAAEPLPLEADADAIRQVVWNLVKNALQASPERGVVTVRARRSDEAVVLEVEDQGEGIPEAEREKLFDMFYSKRARGIGLGLALVHQIVESHKGTISVADGADGGALLRVTLPRRFEGVRPNVAATTEAHP
ncbi:MAG: PAS domain-containing protein [Deltaproteobacteria bacterium]|nr:PAS domain-containing protein [Deltaproteobacteria bacterium]